MSGSFDFDALLDRVFSAVDHQAFVTPIAGIDDPDEVRLLEPIFEALGGPDVDIAGLRAQVRRLADDGLVTPRRAVILLQTLAAHPAGEDLRELARLIGEEEHLVLREGGPRMAARLAVVDHHRGVHAFLLGRYEHALELETRSAAARPWGDSLANILILLLRLDQEPRARALLAQIRGRFPMDLVRQVHGYISQDPDLALLRDDLAAPPARPEATPEDGGHERPAPDGPDPADPLSPEADPWNPVLH